MHAAIDQQTKDFTTPLFYFFSTSTFVVKHKGHTVALQNDCDTKITRVRSGNFGHQVNSDIHLQTVEIQMMSRLIYGG